MLIAATVMLVVVWAFAELLFGGVYRRIPYERAGKSWIAVPLPPERRD